MSESFAERLTFEEFEEIMEEIGAHQFLYTIKAVRMAGASDTEMEEGWLNRQHDSANIIKHLIRYIDEMDGPPDMDM